MIKKQSLSREQVFKKIGFKHVTYTHKEGYKIIIKNRKKLKDEKTI